MTVPWKPNNELVESFAWLGIEIQAQRQGPKSEVRAAYQSTTLSSSGSYDS